ncbi:hypothetical protein W97_01851 [Coniosporium apollinis CBS 100218]|uniref:Thymocyte nuclear protein 1 n=1 Tax=Coniosporium apollinis (strain CBS 100218) TaxID=1168221 RepID=R7YL39_CONA1|nr:uncharacterized protein W97_01851 [Coniosporium apollinis CBS 100218]EON62627.1 hypothetical protein W97_01851 [Coniosporium apollinis CBS 100218]
MRAPRGSKIQPVAETASISRPKRGAAPTELEEPKQKRAKKSTATTATEVKSVKSIATKGAKESNGEIATGETTETPKRRGRPAKVAAVTTVVQEEDAGVEVPPDPPKRRGRPAKNAAVEEEPHVEPQAASPADPPKRKGRPAKIVAVEEEPEPEAEVSAPANPPKRRGRPAKNADDEEEAEAVLPPTEPPKRRGRAAKVVDVEEVAATAPAETPKRRGRPSKTAPAIIDNLIEKVLAPTEAPKRRGRAPKTAPIEQEPEPPAAAETAAPKRRGRAPKAAVIEEDHDEPEVEVEPPAPTETPKRRGRPARSAVAPAEESTLQPAEAPKARGRPKKVAAEPKAETAPAPATPGRRGRSAAQQLVEEAEEAGQAAQLSPAIGRGKRNVTAKEAKAPSKVTKPTTRKAPAKGTTAKARATTSGSGRGKNPPFKSPLKRAGQEADIDAATAAGAAEDMDIDIDDEHDAEEGPSYWLMKSEAESRLENGVDVKFSIDDLMAAAAPEEWDGVRNTVARNNMQAMKKGDLAFFYHSNTKTPAIVGIMEIVEEAHVDDSQFDTNSYKYDAKSSQENPRWHCVSVSFRQKFPEPVTLPELKRYAKSGGILENMQLFKQSRLSVTKVSKAEWNFIMSLANETGDENDVPMTDLEAAAEAAWDAAEDAIATAETIEELVEEAAEGARRARVSALEGVTDFATAFDAPPGLTPTIDSSALADPLEAFPEAPAADLPTAADLTAPYESNLFVPSIEDPFASVGVTPAFTPAAPPTPGATDTIDTIFEVNEERDILPSAGLKPAASSRAQSVARSTRGASRQRSVPPANGGPLRSSRAGSRQPSVGPSSSRPGTSGSLTATGKRAPSRAGSVARSTRGTSRQPSVPPVATVTEVVEVVEEQIVVYEDSENVPPGSALGALGGGILNGAGALIEGLETSIEAVVEAAAGAEEL